MIFFVLQILILEIFSNSHIYKFNSRLHLLLYLKIIASNVTIDSSQDTKETLDELLM